jgi:hypothetical protein
MRGLLLIAMLVLTATLAACGDDGGEAVTAAGPATPVQVGQLVGDPGRYAREDVMVEGAVTRVLPGTTDRFAFFIGDLLVLAPTADEVRRGDRVTAEGNFRRLEADDLSDVGEALGLDEQTLGDYEGTPTVFATRVVSAGTTGTNGG